MQNTVDISLIICIYAVVIGAGWGTLVDPLRPASSWVAGGGAVLTGFLITGLAPAAVMSAPLLVLAFSVATFVRDRRWRRGLIPRESSPRTPPPPAPSTSASE